MELYTVRHVLIDSTAANIHQTRLVISTEHLSTLNTTQIGDTRVQRGHMQRSTLSDTGQQVLLTPQQCFSVPTTRTVLDWSLCLQLHVPREILPTMRVGCHQCGC